VDGQCVDRLLLIHFDRASTLACSTKSETLKPARLSDLDDFCFDLILPTHPPSTLTKGKEKRKEERKKERKTDEN
jgi:hypothetical protein